MNGGAPWPVLDLFAGYGGFTLACDAVGDFRTIGFSEIDPYANAILEHRFACIPNLGPVQRVTRDSVLAACGVLPVVVTGGFPCQPHSLAGLRSAADDERDLWGECARVLRDLRPPFAIFENVPGLFSSDGTTPSGVVESGLFFNRVLSDLAELRYAAQWAVVSAADVGATHKRARVWILCVDQLAYADRLGRGEGERADPSRLAAGAGRDGARLAHGDGAGLQGPLHARDDDSQGRQGPLDAVAGPGGRDGRELADAHRGRGDQDHESGELRADRPEQPPRDRGYAAARAEREITAGLEWPAARGAWPAPPGPYQYEWEPDRVIGGWAGRLTAGAAEAQPDVGRGADGPAAGLDAVAEEVRAAAVGDYTFYDAREAEGDESNLNNLDPDELERLAQADEGPDAEGDAVNRTNRLKAVGNGIVPACAYIFAAAIADVLEARGVPS